MKDFAKGVNLGGWLSQFPPDDPQHFDTFITQADIERIAAWGLDHVRLPVDYHVLESDDAVGVPIEAGYAHIENCLRWCTEAGLGMVLDLHRAPGYVHQNVLSEHTRAHNTLFDNRASQRRFIALWQTIVSRFADASTPLVFELLNEVVIPEVGPWNRLLVRTVDAMREIAPNCRVLIGGNTTYGTGDLHDLELGDDRYVHYTFHFYEPLLFTHQNAHWMPEAVEWGGSPTYPGEFAGLDEYLERAPHHRARHGAQVGRTADRDLIAEYLQPAIAFYRNTGRSLYCGEFGVGQWVDPASRRNWLADVVAEFTRAGIGRALWTYKALDFGLVDLNGDVVDQEFVDILVGR